MFKEFTLRADRWFALGQVTLGLCLLACLVIIPHYFFSLDQGGVSNFGTEPQTRVLFVLGFGAATAGTFLAALFLPARSLHELLARLGMGVLSILYLAVALTTFSYKLDPSYRQIHEYAAVALFVAMFIGALWLRAVGVLDKVAQWAFVVFCLSIAVGLSTLSGQIHVLFTVQLVGGGAFGCMVWRVLRRLEL